jgi:hypothetical protein
MARCDPTGRNVLRTGIPCLLFFTLTVVSQWAHALTLWEGSTAPEADVIAVSSALHHLGVALRTFI